VISHVSFMNVKQKWWLEIKHHCPNATFFVVGTKVDLRDDAETIEKLRQRQQVPISYEDGATLAKELGAVGYAECSALTQKG
jgi:GTPase SAR1 family protein